MVHIGASIAAMNAVSIDGAVNTAGVNTNGESMSGGNMSGQSGATITAIATHRTPMATTIPINADP